MRSAIVNAFDRLVRKMLAKVVHGGIRQYKAPLPSICSCQRVGHGVVKSFNLRKVKDPRYRDSKFGWLSSLRSSVWLDRLRAGSVVDRWVPVYGDKKGIRDSEERKPVQFNLESLRACGSDEAEELYIAEGPELYESSN